MSTYRLFFIADKNKSGLIKQLSERLVRLKNSTDKRLSSFLPEIPQEAGLRMAILIRDIEDLKQKLEKAIQVLTANETVRFSPKDKIFISSPTIKPGKTVFLFPGFGSEFPGMLTGILSKFTAVSKWMNLFEEHFNRTEDRDAISQDEWLESQLEKKQFGVAEAGPIGSITSLAFNDILHTLGIQCDAMIGHSNGENAALISSGIMQYDSNEQFLNILRMLSEFPQPVKKNGVYLAVNNFSKQHLDDLLDRYPNDVFLAMNNCPGQQVLFTKLAVREVVIAFIKKRYGLVFDLQTDHPYHTKEFKSSLDYLIPVYKNFTISKGSIPVYSCVNSSFFPENEEEIRALALRQWVEPVDFQKTIKKAYDDGARTFIEVGPNNRLSGFVTDTLKGKDFLLLTCSKENTAPLDMLIEMCAKLWVQNRSVDLSYFTTQSETKSTQYQEADSKETNYTKQKIFEAHQELMQEFLRVNDSITNSFLNRLKQTPETKEVKAQAIHNLLLNGEYKTIKQGLEFTGSLDLSKHKLMYDHAMGGVLPVVPFTMSLELLAEIGALLIKPTTNALTILEAKGNQWLDFETNSLPIKIQAVFDETETSEKIVSIKVYRDSDKNELAVPAFEGKLSYAISPKKVPVIDLGTTKSLPSISMSDFYKDHLFHGTCFTSMHTIHFWNDKGVSAEFKMPDLSQALEGITKPAFVIPGPMLDSTGQLMAYWLYEMGMSNYAIFPFQLGSFEQYSPFPPAGSTFQCKAKISKAASVITGSFEFIDANGNCIGKLNDFRLRIFIHEWIPLFLMNRLDQGNPETLTADFLSEGGGIWKKILGKLKLKDKEYDQWLASSNNDQINYLLALEAIKFSSK